MAKNAAKKIWKKCHAVMEKSNVSSITSVLTLPMTAAMTVKHDKPMVHICVTAPSCILPNPTGENISSH